MSGSSRLDLPLPPYRHRPGRTPHPERDPDGHRFLDDLPAGLLPAAPIPLTALSQAPLFLYGERLFRADYWWEAHAVWEELWRAAPPATPERAVLRAFIQLAAAALKQELGSPRGSRKLLVAAHRHLEQAACHKEAGVLPERFRMLRSVAGVPSTSS